MKYDELNHFSHPQHKLRFEYSELPFKCDGCREVGIGSRFKCSLCDFDLHTHCAAATVGAIALRHPFYPKCRFYFFPSPPGDSPRYCNACGRNIAGFVYHCRTCGFDLHPCCAALPHVLNADGGLRLHLQRRASANCHRCGRKGRSWSYRSECKKYNLHVACVTEMLVESWHELYYGGGGGGGGGGKKVMVSGNRIPAIRGAGMSHHRSGKGKVKRCCELAAMAVQFVISAVLGDPTTVIAGVVSSFLFR
ncbi:uncharacterized protein LOC110100745 [Dendrobium catenatum]|uniref:Phorbol-ester/DAG-type domain-containing protein n=1 Tax=Dendrobium catenatum TaxID=906689 RepID=A0A2I0WWC1_9ASPA|nr:uncharacterized protein LOC110100745 [Dendrobium catenatum]PKU79941.1 hypothetical protein MA16_Dca025096 [Dendrobium catenatum]